MLEITDSLFPTFVFIYVTPMSHLLYDLLDGIYKHYMLAVSYLLLIFSCPDDDRPWKKNSVSLNSLFRNFESIDLQIISTIHDVNFT